MTIGRRLDALERAVVDDDGCSSCGAPGRVSTTQAAPNDLNIGGCCPGCRRLLALDGRPFGDYWALLTGERVGHGDNGGLVWRADGGPIRLPDHAVKVYGPEAHDAI
jgi:hypothetical protein